MNLKSLQWIRQYYLYPVALLIAVGALVASHYFVRDLANTERNNMALWAEAMTTLNNADETTDLSLVLKVINSNQNIPVIVLSDDGEVLTHRNVVLDATNERDSIVALQAQAKTMLTEGYSMTMPMETGSLIIAYDESMVLKRLYYYPYALLAVIAVFFVLAFSAFITAKRAEQNKVWVGLSKETAHQLGTPISSLMAWVELLKETYPQDALIGEMGKDIARLQLITERFSKIGSVPELTKHNIVEVLQRVSTYMRLRAPRHVHIEEEYAEATLLCSINPPLFEWVIENLYRNSIDAMGAEGTIRLSAQSKDTQIIIDLQDTGKGIPRQLHKKIFKPGFTTKKRGWGLGLSLAKRIIESYHHGKIFVRHSEPGKGACFRIVL